MNTNVEIKIGDYSTLIAPIGERDMEAIIGAFNEDSRKHLPYDFKLVINLNNGNTVTAVTKGFKDHGQG